MFKIIKKIVFYVLIFYLTSLIIWAAHIFSLGSDAAIFMYHSVGEPLKEENSLDVPEAIFERQLKFLYDHHYRVISLEELLLELSSKKPIPPKTVVLTFDDGYENNYTKMFPILKKYRFPATIFIVVNYLGKEKEVNGHIFKFMIPEMLKEMSDSGLVSIGAHTMDHIFLPQLADAAELKRQVFGSKEALEKILGKPVNVFCYPAGGYDMRIAELVRHAGYKAAVTTMPKEKGYACQDIYALKRIKLSKRFFNPLVMFVKASGYYLKMKEGNSR